MIFLIGFILAVFCAFYVPGRVLLGKTELPSFSKIAVSITAGIVLWALQGAIFGYLQIRWASYLYLLLFMGMFIKEGYYRLLWTKKEWKIDFISLLLICIGVIGQTLPYVQTGWRVVEGIIFTSHNPEDHIWHAALVKELGTHFPPNEPAIAGVTLKDYHYFYNLVTADLIRVFHLPFFATQFDGMYILAPILLGIIVYAIAQKIWQRKLFTWFSLLLIFFSGDAAGWVMLVMRHTFTWSLSSLINDASKFMDSPPYGYAIVIGLTGLYLLLQRKNTLRILVLCTILFGSMLEFKIYVGIPFLFAFGAYAIGALTKKQITPFISFIGASILAVILLKLGSSSSAGLIFLPVDIPRDFINQPLLELKDWQFRWIIYQDHHSVFRLIQYGAMMSGLYLIVQFGLLLFGLLPYPPMIKKLGLPTSLFFYGGILSACILGLFFYQTVGGANIWEFFLAAIPLLAILLGLSLAILIIAYPVMLQVAIVCIVTVIIIPQWFITLHEYISSEYFSGFHGISNAEIASYAFLATKTSPQATILFANQKTYSYASIANLLVNRDIFLSGNGVRQIITPEIAKRREEVTSLTNSTDSLEISQILKSEHLSYVYYYGSPANIPALKGANLRRVFINSFATIFKLN